jgi:hypothetical protein
LLHLPSSMARPRKLFETLRAQILETPHHLSWPTQLATRNEAEWDHRHTQRVLTQMTSCPEITRFKRLIMAKKSTTKRRMLEWIYRPKAYQSFETEFEEMRDARRALREQVSLTEIGNLGEDIAWDWLRAVDACSEARFQVTASGRPAPGSKEGSFDYVFNYGDDFGLEVKNELAPLKRPILKSKLVLAEEMRVRPIFLVRRMHQNHARTIAAKNGVALAWGVQFVPESLRAPAELLAGRYGLPIRVGRPTATEMRWSASRFVDARLKEFIFDRVRPNASGGTNLSEAETDEILGSLKVDLRRSRAEWDAVRPTCEWVEE